MENYRETVLARGPIAYWQLDEESGTTALSTEVGPNGTYAGAMTLGVPGAVVGGGPAVDFNGGHVNCTDFDMTPNGAISLAGWVQPKQYGGGRRIFWKDSSGSLGWAVSMGDPDGTTGRVRFFIRNLSTVSLDTPVGVELPLDVWTLLVATHDPVMGSKLYFDSEIVAQSSRTGSMEDNAGPFVIAGNDVMSASRAFVGIVDETAVWDRALTPEEIRTLYVVGAGRYQRWNGVSLGDKSWDGDPRVVTRDFETGDLTRWDTTEVLAVATDRVRSGTHAGYSKSTSTPGTPLATVTPPELKGGEQIRKFEYWFQETSAGSHGSGIRLLNSLGQIELGLATDNPEWYVDDANGLELVQGNTSNYDRWVRFTVYFYWVEDPTSGMFTIDFEDSVAGNRVISQERPLKHGLDIATIVLENFNSTSGGFRTVGNVTETWWDDITIERWGPKPDFPPVTQNLVVDFDAHEIAEPDGALVDRWPDRMNGHDALSDGAGARPTLLAEGFNGRPCLEFSGAQYLTTPNFGAREQPNTMFVVHRYSSLDDRYTHDGIVGSERHLIYRGSGNTRVWAGSALVVEDNHTDQRIYATVYDGSSTTVRSNGSQVTSGNAGTHSLSGLTIGGRYNITSFMFGEIAHILVYDRELSLVEIQAVEEWLLSRWGVVPA